MEEEKKQNKIKREGCPLCDISEETVQKLRESKGRKPKDGEPSKTTKSRFFQKFLIGTASFGGILSGALGAIGITGLCCAPLVVGFLGFFGISSSMFLLTWNKWFLGAGLFFLALAGYFFWRYQKKKYYLKINKVKETKKEK
jgi:hypothetical protein